MNKIYNYLLAVILVPTLSHSYIAKISQADHYNSRGVKLNDAEDILRQDRANYHKFNKRDAEDESDNYFNTLDHRSNMSRFIRNGGGLSQDVKDKIENSNPLVSVEVNGDVVNVSIIDNLASTISTSSTNDNIPIAKTISANKEEINNQFKDAALRNLRDEQRALLQKNPDVNIVINDNNDTALHINVKNKNLDIIKTLIQKGATVDKENIKGETPLYTAVKYGYMDIAKYLISHGANVNKHVTVWWEDYKGDLVYHDKSTLLAQAAKNEKPTVIKNLLELGANPNMVENQKELETPLNLLSENTDNKIYDSAQALINRGAKVDVPNHLEQAPIHSILFTLDLYQDNLKEKQLFDDWIKTAKLLIEKGAKLNRIDHSNLGASPSILGASLGLDFIKYMQKHGAKLDIVGSDNLTMLHEVKDYDSAKYLLDHGLKKYINYIHNDETPLYKAVDDKNYELAKLYIENGAKTDINYYNDENILWALDLEYLSDATKAYEIEEVLKLTEFLIQHGANINHKNRDSKTVLDEVITTNSGSFDYVNAKVIDFLINHGAKLKRYDIKEIEEYYKAVNSGDLEKLKKILDEDAYKNVLTQLHGECKADDKVCLKKELKKKYGVKKNTIIHKDGNVVFILVKTNEGVTEIQKLIITEDGISFGTK